MMNKKASLILLAVFLCISSPAQVTNIVSIVSPKLRQFLADHSTASKSLSSAFSEAFPTRTVQIYYFYSDDESVARASHYYPDKSVVGILIRENQQPCDECLCLIFEVLNSEGEARFEQLADQAKAWTISRADFVKEIMRQEFQAVKKTQALMGNFKLSPKEITDSYYYNLFIKCPSDFEDFLVYKKKGQVHRDQTKEYEQLYNSLRQTPSRPTRTPESTSGMP